MFDADFFNVRARDAEVMDPQQRVFLECAWEALENAGYDPDRFPGLIGVWAGASFPTYLLHNLCADRAFIENLAGNYQYSGQAEFMGNDANQLATRVAYKLNLRGPALTVQTACSTSLVAVAQACQALLAYQTDLALAGGVSITFPQRRGYLYQDGAMTSADGHCRAFDAGAKGTIFSNGAGVVVLKRLDEALADGDRIIACIKGTAVNNDGAGKMSFTAPSAEGQAEVILIAQAAAGVEAASISYVEAHGTATPLGDPIEFAGLVKAFRAGETADAGRTGYCALGSVKTNIGHLEQASGVAALIKTALALHHRLIPPSLHFRRANPQIDLANSPFYVNTTALPWVEPADDQPRRAGVSSFGVGGTNAHAVLEEAPAPENPAAPSPRPAELLVLSARTETALAAATQRLAAHFRANPELDLADTAFTLRTGRRAWPHRRVLAASSLAEAADLLDGSSAPGARVSDPPQGESTCAPESAPGTRASRPQRAVALAQTTPDPDAGGTPAFPGLTRADAGRMPALPGVATPIAGRRPALPGLMPRSQTEAAFTKRLFTGGGEALRHQPPVAFLFPGQGAQRSAWALACTAPNPCSATKSTAAPSS